MLDINSSIKILIILIFGICIIKLFDYDKRVTKSKKVLYFLFPFALIVILIYDQYHKIFISDFAKQVIKLTALATFFFSFYIYLTRKSQSYSYQVYSTSVYIIWSILIIFGLIFIYDSEMLVKAGLMKLILYGGLMISLI